MEKCWFVLKQHHYLPPTRPDPVPGDPIRLGHIFADWKKVDKVINRTPPPNDFPTDMPVIPTDELHFNWRVNNNGGFEMSVEADVPILPSQAELKAGIGARFKRTVKDFQKFEKLETEIVQITRPYIAGELVHDEVKGTLKGQSAWSLFMVSGMKIARKVGERGHHTTNENAAHVHGGGGAPGVAHAKAKVGAFSKGGVHMAAKSGSDFIWALRFVKISKGWFGKDWDYDTLVTGATFNQGNEGKDVIQVLEEEGVKVGNGYVLEKEIDGSVFIIQEASVEEDPLDSYGDNLEKEHSVEMTESDEMEL